MSQQLITMRIDDKLVKSIDEYAKVHSGGNRSEAIRDLLQTAIAHNDEDAIASAINEAVERGLERVIKAESRGAKASLGTLVLLSKFLPALFDISVCNSKYLIKGFNHEELNDEAIYDALLDCDDMENIKSNDAFAYAWECAGNIQSHGTRPTLDNATKNMKARGISYIVENNTKKGKGNNVS